MKNIEITLISQDKTYNPVGFNSGKLVLKGIYDDSLLNIMNNFNNFRSPENQIKNLYTINNIKISQNMWDFKLKDSLTFYVKKN